jgi:hypothetical protein
MKGDPKVYTRQDILEGKVPKHVHDEYIGMFCPACLVVHAGGYCTEHGIDLADGLNSSCYACGCVVFRHEVTFIRWLEYHKREGWRHGT